ELHRLRSASVPIDRAAGLVVHDAGGARARIHVHAVDESVQAYALAVRQLHLRRERLPASEAQFEISRLGGSAPRLLVSPRARCPPAPRTPALRPSHGGGARVRPPAPTPPQTVSSALCPRAAPSLGVAPRQPPGARRRSVWKRSRARCTRRPASSSVSSCGSSR